MLSNRKQWLATIVHLHMIAELQINLFKVRKKGELKIAPPPSIPLNIITYGRTIISEIQKKNERQREKRKTTTTMSNATTN